MFDVIINYLKNHKVKYAHIFRFNGIFSDSFLKFSQLHKDVFRFDQSIFIIDDCNVTSNFDKFQNVIYVKQLSTSESLLITVLCQYVDVVVAHYLDKNCISKIRPEDRHKIVWRTWGNDLYAPLSYFPSIKLKIKHCIKNVKWHIIGRRIANRFKMIGISSTGCDKLIMKKCGLKIDSMLLPYPKDNEDLSFSDITNFNSKHKVTFMVGHFANSSLNHIKWIKKINKLKNVEANLFIPLAYGRKKYANKVTRYLEKHSKIDYEILNNEIPFTKYVDKLKNVDIAIFDSKNQMALSNIITLLALQKMVLLNKRGVVFKTLRLNGLNVYSTSKINYFEKNHFKPELLAYEKRVVDFARVISCNKFVLDKWGEFFDACEKKDTNRNRK